LEGSLRVTVIATGFGDPVEEEAAPARPEPVQVRSEPIVIGSRYDGPQLVDAPEEGTRVPAAEEPWTDPSEAFEDLEIPTFIRRQMD